MLIFKHELNKVKIGKTILNQIKLGKLLKKKAPQITT